ncbi:putative FUN34-transmembrane protein [Acaromyces ingoldii]|uniref:Putative FUN34-transmembrane protein n=1 Tax=Acaromyces ingoldii TaxID=215250 RepID=A0A316YH26_9BASI|nr:putative FUN34-transmembrane protein [Acaromyces ingoldii]PWN88451.1 putative FUN34-transmembrane protein [Acaromyces ingoldii]
MSEHTKAENGGFQGGVPTQRAVTPGGHPQDSSQPAFPIYHRKFANPAPLGLFGFAATTFVLSLYNVAARGVAVPNAVLGLAIGYGGMAQFVAGVWEFAAGNTFGATAFCSYGAFWWSYAILFIPWFGVKSAFVSATTSADEAGAMMSQAVGLYLAAWFIFTFILLLASFRSSLGLVLLFFFLDLTFLLLFIAEFTANAKVQKAGGGFGIVTAAIAWYVGAAGLLSPDTSYFTLPVLELSRKD